MQPPPPPSWPGFAAAGPDECPAPTTVDEASMERSKSFVKALQELKNLRPQLYSASEYYEKSYLHREQKQIPMKKRKSQYELSNPRLSSLKYKFQSRLSWQDDESARTESFGHDGIFVDKNYDTDMVNTVEELNSCENTQSLLGDCIEVDSINGVESQSMRKAFQFGPSTSSSSSNNISSDALSSSHSSGTKGTDSWVMQHLEHDHPSLVLQPYDDDIERIYDVLGQYDGVIKNELATGDVDGSAARIMDEKLYSNGVDDLLVLSTVQTGCYDEKKKKLTIDQEFEQYFSRLML